MEETKKLKFPVASIFTVFVIAGMAMDLYIYLTRPYKFDDRIGYRILVEFGGTYTPLHLIYQALLIGSMVLLTVLLFMRKRNGLLSGNAGSITHLYTCKLFAQQWLPGLF